MTYISNEQSEAIYLRFLRLAGINILSNIMIPFAGLVDMMFLGHLADIRYLAGVALATVIFNVIYRNCNFLRMGTTGPTARGEGQNDLNGVAAILFRNGAIALGLGVLILLLQHPLQVIGLAILDTSSGVKLAAEDYFNTRIWGAPAVLLNLVLIGWFLGREQNGKVLLLSAIANGVNILLDYWLIYRWDLASAGAGIATAASQYLLLLLALFFVARERWLLEVSLTLSQIFDWTAMRSLLTLNSNIWMRMIVSTLTLAAFMEISATFGETVIAINALLFQVLMITLYCAEGLSFTTERLSGLFHGQGNTQNFGSLLQIATITSSSLGGAISLLFIILPQPLFSLLTNHLEIINELKDYLLWLLPLLIFSILGSMLDGYFAGFTEGKMLRNAAFFGVTLGFIPLAITACKVHNVHFLWLALCAYMTLRFIVLRKGVSTTLKQPELS